MVSRHPDKFIKWLIVGIFGVELDLGRGFFLKKTALNIRNSLKRKTSYLICFNITNLFFIFINYITTIPF